MNMQRYAVNQFDNSTYQVVDQYELREICVCADYNDWEDSEARAQKIAKVLNKSDGDRSKLQIVRLLKQIFILH